MCAYIKNVYVYPHLLNGICIAELKKILKEYTEKPLRFLKEYKSDTSFDNYFKSAAASQMYSMLHTRLVRIT